MVLQVQVLHLTLCVCHSQNIGVLSYYIKSLFDCVHNVYVEHKWILGFDVGLVPQDNSLWIYASIPKSETLLVPDISRTGD